MRYSGFALSAFLLGSVELLKCSEPTTKSLLNAMREEVILYSDARPVISLNTPTNVTMDLTLYGILGVVNNFDLTLTKPWQIVLY